VLRLYHPLEKKWKLVTVDDKFPCKKGTTTPLFAKPNGRELWVMLIEKAYAKFLGGFDLLDGGLITAALHVLTGDPIYKMMKTTDGKRYVLCCAVFGTNACARGCNSIRFLPSVSSAVADRVLGLCSRMQFSPSPAVGV
jgi:hypothetical protein